MDKCKNCFRLNPVEIKKCNKCGEENATFRYDGHSRFFNCPSCQHEYISFSFFAPCEKDNEYHYKLILLDNDFSRDQLFILKKLFNISIVELYNNIDKYRANDTNYYLYQVLYLSEYFDENNIKYKWYPNPYEEYSKIKICDKSIILPNINDVIIERINRG